MLMFGINPITRIVGIEIARNAYPGRSRSERAGLRHNYFVRIVGIETNLTGHKAFSLSKY